MNFLRKLFRRHDSTFDFMLSGLITDDGMSVTLTCAKCNALEERRLLKPLVQALQEAKLLGMAWLERHQEEQEGVFPISWTSTGGTASTINRCAECGRLLCRKCCTYLCPFCGSVRTIDALDVVVKRPQASQRGG